MEQYCAGTLILIGMVLGAVATLFLVWLGMGGGW
jgi:hypothetical protein